MTNSSPTEQESVVAERYPQGESIAPGFLPTWGLIDEEDSAYDRPLAEQVAAEIGPGEAVEPAEVYELCVALAQHAYDLGQSEPLTNDLPEKRSRRAFFVDALRTRWGSSASGSGERSAGSIPSSASR